MCKSDPINQRWQLRRNLETCKVFALGTFYSKVCGEMVGLNIGLLDEIVERMKLCGFNVSREEVLRSMEKQFGLKTINEISFFQDTYKSIQGMNNNSKKSGAEFYRKNYSSLLIDLNNSIKKLNETIKFCHHDTKTKS